MSNQKPDLTTALGRLVGICSISALLILWISVLVFGIGWLFGQDWAMADIALTNLFILGVAGFVGVVCYWR